MPAVDELVAGNENRIKVSFRCNKFRLKGANLGAARATGGAETLEQVNGSPHSLCEHCARGRIREHVPHGFDTQTSQRLHTFEHVRRDIVLDSAR